MRRFRHEYDDNDAEEDLVFGITLRIDYDRNIVRVLLSQDETLEVFNQIPRHSFISAETEGMWYVGQINHRAYDSNTGEIVLRVDPHAKFGNYSNGDQVTVEIEQTD